jgi:oxygen-independent coproporphyrinogen-3 oxidase
MAGIYLHIPFCEHKCIYCDFYSIENLDMRGSFLNSIRKEITLYADFGKREKVETIYFGGGTPSLLTAAGIYSILDLLNKTFQFAPQLEITLEANPGTVDKAKLKEYHGMGINRLSFGIQSFHDDDLKFLTRIHNSSEAKECILSARAAGFENISLDLIYGIPNQTLKRWEENLHCAVELKPEHISAYSLIIEEDTPLSRMVNNKQVSLISLDAEAELYEFTMSYLQAQGYEHYEVSNYSLKSFRSRHNSNYWNHTNYLGFGPTAHSFWSGKRWWNCKELDMYCKKLEFSNLPKDGEEILRREQLLDESIMLGLRSDGINFYQIKSKYGLDLLDLKAADIYDLISRKFAVMNEEILRLTDAGFLVCDEICKLLIPSKTTV